MNPKHKRPKIISITVIMLLLIMVGLLLPKIQALDSTEEDMKNKAAFLISTFNNSNASITQTVSTLRERGIIIPQPSITSFKEAQVLANQAIVKNHEGSFSEAANLAVQALQKLKIALYIIYSETDVSQTEQEISIQRTFNMQNTIDREYEALHHLENMTNAAATHGTDVTAVKQKISQIKADLDAATSSLNKGDLSQAEKNISQAETSIAELTAYFDSLAVSFKVERIALYINTAEERLATLEQELNSVSNQLSATAQAQASAAITQAENSLTKAKQFLNSQQVNQTIDELAKMQENAQTVTDQISTVAPSPTPTATPNTSTRRSNASSLNASSTKANAP